MSGSGSEEPRVGDAGAEEDGTAAELDLAVLAAAAASLARPDAGGASAPSAGPSAGPSVGSSAGLGRRRRGPAAPRAARRARGRWSVPAEVLVVVGLGVALVVFAGTSGSGTGAPSRLEVGLGGTPGGDFGPGAGSDRVEVAGEVVSPAAPGGAPASSTTHPEQPGSPPGSAPPVGAPGPGRPAPPASTPRPPVTVPTTSTSSTTTTSSTSTTTTEPGPVVTATGASVVSCSRDGALRTLVFRYVLTGSADDGPHEDTVSGQGRIVVATVVAPLPGGGTTTVPLQPGPVECA